MSNIRGRDTKPELTLRRGLHARGFRYRLHAKNLPGKPDLVLSKYKVAIFVHGCFWHRHQDCKHASTPRTRPDFWQEKFRKNRERDSRNVRHLEELGWRVIVVWECELKGERTPARIDRVAALVSGGS